MPRDPMNVRRSHEEICGARTRDGSPCQRSRTPGRTRCKFHGGARPVGFAASAYKHGRYSKHLPGRMLPGYRKSLRDENLLTLTEQIAILDARIEDLLVRSDSGEAGVLWVELRSTYRALQIANRDGNLDVARLSLVTLGDLITRGAVDSAIWLEIRSTFESRRKLVDTERKRLIDMEQLVSVDRMLEFVASLTDVVQQHVTDPDTLTAIAAGLARLLNTDRRRPALAGGGEIDGPEEPESS